MFRKLSKYLNPADLDIYGYKPEIQIQGEPRSYSGVGIFSSCVVAIFVVWATVINSSELFEKKSPTVTTANLPASTYDQSIEITPDVFDLTFGLFDALSGSFYVDPSIYTIQAYYTGDGSDPSTNIQLDVEVCTPSYVQSVAKIVGPTWCISKKQTYETKMKVRTRLQSYINILFIRCDATGSTTCASSTDIDNRLKYSYCIRAYSDWKIDPFNYKQPLQRYYRADWNGVLLTQTKAAYVSLTVAEFTSDNGLLLSNPLTENIVVVEGIDTDLTEMNSSGVFLNLNIANSGNKRTYSRSYTKFQDVLAQIGGLCSLFIFIVSLLVKPYSKFKMYESFVNKVFRVGFDQTDIVGKTDKKDLENSTSFDKQSKEDCQVNNVSYEEHSRVGLKNPYGQPGLESNADISILKLDDGTIDYNSPEKAKFVFEAYPQIKEDEISQSKPKPYVTNNPVNIQASLKIQPLIKNLEISSEISDPRPNAKLKKNVTHLEEKGITKESEGLRKTPTWWRCRLRNKITPLSDKKKPKNLSVGYFEYLFAFLRPKSKQKIKAIGKGSKQIMLQLDFSMLFRKLIEIDRLKMCLLTTDQRMLFDNLSKPTLNMLLRAHPGRKKLEEEMFGPEWIDETPPNISQMEEAYWNLKRGGCQSVVDQNIVSIYDRNKEMIESLFKS